MVWIYNCTYFSIFQPRKEQSTISLERKVWREEFRKKVLSVLFYIIIVDDYNLRVFIEFVTYANGLIYSVGLWAFIIQFLPKHRHLTDTQHIPLAIWFNYCAACSKSFSPHISLDLGYIKSNALHFLHHKNIQLYVWFKFPHFNHIPHRVPLLAAGKTCNNMPYTIHHLTLKKAVIDSVQVIWRILFVVIIRYFELNTYQCHAVRICSSGPGCSKANWHEPRIKT